MQSELVEDNLYEIPACTICLQQLTQDLSSLACGHVFHISCITQHFEYRGSCPNCQKRAVLKEIRLVVYPVVKNNNATAHLRRLLANFGNSEAGQVQCLLSEIKNLSEMNDKFKNDIRQFEKEHTKNQTLIEDFRRDIQSNKAEINLLNKESRIYKSECSKFAQQNQKLENQNIDLMANLGLLQDQKKQFEQYKALQKAAQGSSEQMTKYKNQLQNKHTPPEIMVKSFYQMLQLKNLNVLKTKEKQKQLTEKYRIKQDEISKYRQQIRMMKQQIEQIQNQKLRVKRKFDQLRVKYKQLTDKYRKNQQDGIQCPDGQDSMNSLSISMKLVGFKAQMPPLQPQKPTNNFKLVQKPKIQQKLSFGNSNLKKKAVEEENKVNKSSIKNFMLG